MERGRGARSWSRATSKCLW